MLAGLLVVGPLESGSVAGTCSSPAGGSTTSSLTALVSEATGVPSGVYATSIRWVRWHSRVRYGDTAVLEGQVVTQDGAVPDAAVDLFAQEAGSDEWVPVGSATSDSDTGVFSFGCLRPAMTTDYRAVYQGTVLYSGSQGERKVEVARRVPDSMTQVASDRFRFQGSVQPRYTARPVLLQRKSCSTCRWTTVGRTSTNSRSGWRFLVDVSGFTGRRWFRAVVPGDQHFVTGYSDRTWRLTHR
jgi:hypothetical protein